MNPIYLDYNATTPIDPQVAEAMLPYIHQHFGNPSSNHTYGVRARKAVDEARQQVAHLLGCRDEEVIFTSGGTEANNYAIKGVVGAYKEKGNHIITSAVEHPAVIEVCKYLEGQGCRVTYLPVDQYGLVAPEQVREAITPRTVLVSIMHANNEVGTIEPIREIAEIAHQHGVLVHADCAQSVGKIPVRVDDLGVDLLSIAGHKLYAPKGVGALYVRSGVKLEKLIHGASHEMDWRAGTENVIEVVGLGKACQMIDQDLSAYSQHMGKMRDRLEDGLKREFAGLRINGHPEKRLPNTCSASFKGVEANTLLAAMDNVAASAGAACHSDKVEVSSVLAAMQVPLEYAMGAIRLSVGRYTTEEEIDRALDEIQQAVGSYRKVGVLPRKDEAPLLQSQQQLPNDAPAIALFPQYESELYQMIADEVKGLTDEQLDFESERWEWSKWSIRRNLSHMASGDFRWLVSRWGDVLFPNGPPDIDDLEGILNSPYDRRLDEAKYWAVDDILRKLREGLELSLSVLSRETVGSVQSKEVPNPRSVLWDPVSGAHPRGVRPHPQDPQQVLVSLEATFRHRYFEYITHLYNIQRLKRAQGLETKAQIPFEGYWALPNWDRSEP